MVLFCPKKLFVAALEIEVGDGRFAQRDLYIK